MESYANSLSGGHDPSVVKAIPYGVFDKDAAEEISAAITASALVVDCSASIAVGRYISHKLAGNTRAVSFFMNPSGTSLIMLLESSSRSTRLDTLEMQYYRMLIRESALSEHLKSDQRVLYASTCRGTSLVYPQDNAAIFSGFCSKAIKETQISEEASVSIWVVNGLALERYEELGEIFEEVACGSWHMKISPTVLEKLYSQRENKLPNETGGILIGTYDFAHNICYIVDSIDSPSDSEEYSNAYIRGHNGLKDEVMRIENISIGNLTYVGEWHSHPSNDTHPSGDDLILLKSISEFTYSQGNPGCMMILGERNYSIHLGCR